MGRSSYELYEEWKIQLPCISPRSVLYRLEPIGIRTLQVESLTSYISRVAQAHCVFPGILMRKLIAPFVRDSSAYKDNWQAMDVKHGRQTGSLNGTLLQSTVAVHAFETLTQQHALRFLTLQTWKEVFPYHTLLHSVKVWCPVCLEEWRTSGKVIYDPLLWTFRVVTHCTRHQCMLSTHCPQRGCEREVPWLSWTGIPGHCPYCRQWLGRPAPPSVEMDEDALHWQEWITEQLGTLLALAPELKSPPTRTRIHALLQHFCQQLSQGRFKAFARELGVPWSTVATWFGRQEIPQLETLLRLCTIWGVSLKASLLDELTTLCYLPGLQAPNIERGKRDRKAPENANNSHIRHTLQMILASDEEPPPSLQKVAQQLKISPYYLRKYHLELCNAITARYRVYIQRHREATMKQQCEEVSQMAHQLVTQRVRPTRKKLEEKLSKPGILRSPEIRQAWKTILREYDGEI